jgi:4-diphosphocytidyl-2-C-methyl-D-erythritol kinase
LPGLPDTPLIVGLPPFGIATSEVFARVADKLTLPGIGVNLPLFLGHKWPKENDFRFAVNDLERVVFEGWPELRTFRDAVRDAGARSALLSGSGSTVYGVFGTPGSARQAAQGLAKRFPSWRLLPIRTIAGGVRLDRAT